MRGLSHYEQTWPHPRPRLTDDPVDPRLTRVIRRALREGDMRNRDPDVIADHVATEVWAWLAEGD